MSSITKTKTILKELNHRPRKSLGQNFMVDHYALNKVIEACDDFPMKNVLEVGPGLGYLTEKLAECSQSLIAVEKDKILSEYLRRKFQECDHVRIEENDILQYTYPKQNESLLIVGNIPYEISSPLMEHFLNRISMYQGMIITTQKDFALRLASRPGSRECGALTIWMQLHTDIEILNNISASAFYPKPKVESSIIRILPKGKPLYSAQNREAMHQTIRFAFQKRRKQILNSLLNSPLGFSKDALLRLLREANVGSDARPESLSLSQWVSLGEAIGEEKTHAK